MAAPRDYYEVLEVSREETVDGIKKAYRKLAIKYHPDRNPGDEAAVQAFKEASEAFDVLSNPDKRARYDKFGHAGVSGAAGGGGAGFGDINDIFDAFGDLFGDMLGGGGRRRGGGGGPRPRKGESLRTHVTIDLLDAAVGCSREIEVERHKPCETCKGSGAKPGTSPERCDYCGGQGQVLQAQGFFRLQTTCPACRGAGNVIRQKCPDCRGNRVTGIKSRLEVKIPAGVDNEMQLCVRGEGEPGENGGPAGDLFVDIQVRGHKLFQRAGKDLHCRVPVTFSQATLGAELEIPILTGKHILNLVAGTQPGEVIRLRGFGMPDPHGNSRGDLLVEIQVEVPKKLTKRHEELLRELAELESKQVSSHRKSFFESLKDYFAPTDEPSEKP